MTRGTVGVVALITLAWASGSAQAPSARDVKLVGDRFKPLIYVEMTPEQRTMIEHLVAGERPTTGGPFNVFLRSPEMGDVAQQLGAQIRFHSSLPSRLREMAILIVARHWTAQDQWYAHRQLALQAAFRRPPWTPSPRASRRRRWTRRSGRCTTSNANCFKRMRFRTRRFVPAIAAIGERGVVDLIGLMGMTIWYRWPSTWIDTRCLRVCPPNCGDLIIVF